jgi:hypothetical protein
MSGPRDRDGFDDRPDDAGGWREPEHLGENAGEERTEPSPDPAKDADAWQPAGWDLPSATPPVPHVPADEANRAVERPPYGWSDEPSAPPLDPRGGGLFGRRRTGPPGEIDQVFGYQGDLVGVQGWALQNGWTVSDGSAPQDAVLRELVTSAPVRATKDHHPASVLRGRAGNLELVAFDVVYASGRYLVPEYAVTAAPVLGAVPGFRLSPARFWKHRTGGLLPIASGNELFDSRWLLLAAEDGPQVHRLIGDATVQGLLLGSDDGDEFWSAAGHVAAIRPDGHRPQLLEHHARLLTAIVAALSSGYGADPVR